MPTLERLRDGPHELVAVVSQPDRPRGRRRRSEPSPVAHAARESGLFALRVPTVGTPEVAEALAARTPDLGVVVAFGQFIPKHIRELPTLGYCINGHASLLPRWRGAAPIAHAILAGDTRTGVTLMRLEREMDAGPVASQRAIEITSEETTGELSERLAKLTAEMVAEAVHEIAAGHTHWTPQSTEGVLLAPKLDREQSRLDFRESAESLVRRVRAFSPSPGATVEWGDQALRIHSARAEPGPVDTAPGTVSLGGDSGLRIATRDGWFAPRVLQRPGRRPLEAPAFLRGHPIPDGARFKPAPADG
ncbi:MAG: methionyl-tRNA formyltransferase [bacterium]|nr:methionyl-tRNA formyltransferase [bacterium]